MARAGITVRTHPTGAPERTTDGHEDAEDVAMSDGQDAVLREQAKGTACAGSPAGLGRRTGHSLGANSAGRWRARPSRAPQRGRTLSAVDGGIRSCVRKGDENYEKIACEAENKGKAR